MPPSMTLFDFWFLTLLCSYSIQTLVNVCVSFNFNKILFLKGSKEILLLKKRVGPTDDDLKYLISELGLLLTPYEKKIRLNVNMKTYYFIDFVIKTQSKSPMIFHLSE